MVYGCSYPSCPGDGAGGYFLHLMGYGKGFGNGGGVDDMTQRRTLTPLTPPVKLLELSDAWYYDPTWKNAQWNGGHQTPSPRYVTRRTAARKVLNSERASARKTPGVGSPRLRPGGGKQPLHSPQLRKATDRDSPRVPPVSPLVHMRAGVDSPRLSGRVQKPTRRPKKTVHWKTNIATWIQMNAKNSSISISEASNCDDGRSSQRGNDTSDDDGTMRFNTAGKSVCDTFTAKEEDSSDFEYTDFSQMSDGAEVKRVYFGASLHTEGSHSGTLEALGLPPTLRKPLPPLPVSNPPPEENEAHYYSDLNCSCSSSTHTYEDVEDDEELTNVTQMGRQRRNSGGSESSSHTYCEIEQVNRGSKPEVLHSLLRNDRRLEVLKSTLVHLLPKDDITSTTLLACRLGDLEYLQDLAKQGHLDAAVRDLQGASCLHYAARGGHDHILRFLLEDADQRGVVQCEVGATPLHDAAALGHLSSLQYLVRHSRHGLRLTDKDGANVLHVAAR